MLYIRLLNNVVEQFSDSFSYLQAKAPFQFEERTKNIQITLELCAKMSFLLYCLDAPDSRMGSVQGVVQRKLELLIFFRFSVLEFSPLGWELMSH